MRLLTPAGTLAAAAVVTTAAAAAATAATDMGRPGTGSSLPVASSSSSSGSVAAAAAAAVGGMMATTAAPVVSLPTLWSGIRDLTPACQKAVLGLEARLAMNDTAAFNTVLEATFASGRVIEGLFVLNAGIKAAKANPPAPEDQKEALLNLVIGYPWVSLGSPDACKYVPDFQYCHLDVASVYIRYGLCVPAACTAEDIQVSLNATYFKIAKEYLDSSIILADTAVCGDTTFPATTTTYVMAGVICFLGLLALLGTALDYLRYTETGRRKQEEALAAAATAAANGSSNGGAGGVIPSHRDDDDNKWFMRDNGCFSVLRCFSIIQNWRLLTAKARGGPFDSLDGIRTLSMCWVIFGHTFIFALFFQPTFSNFGSEVAGVDGKGFLATYQAQSITGGYFAVDTFFFLSSFLAVYFMLEEISRIKQRHGSSLSFLVKTPMIYVLRFLRLTPTYMFVILVYVNVIGVLDKGPFWTQMFGADYDVCKRSWWWNLLYVNNIVTQTAQTGQEGASCYPVSWYLAVDFQLFLLTPFVALLAAHYHKPTLGLLGVGTLASIIYTWVQSYKQHWSIDLLDQSDYFVSYYIKPHTRAPPAFIGMALAIVWFFYYRNKTQQGFLPARRAVVGSCNLDRLLVYGLFAAALAVFGATVEGARSAYEDNPPPWSNSLMSAYIALSKPAWTLGLAVFCFLLFLGEGGLIKMFLESRPFTVLSRLTYCAYLTHPTVIYMVYGDHLGPMHYSSIWYLFHFLGFLFCVLIASTLLHLLVERPVANLERLTRIKKPSAAAANGSGNGGGNAKKARDSLGEPLLRKTEGTADGTEEEE